jgi:hypothetical protein
MIIVVINLMLQINIQEVQVPVLFQSGNIYYEKNNDTSSLMSMNLTTMGTNCLLFCNTVSPSLSSK